MLAVSRVRSVRPVGPSRQHTALLTQLLLLLDQIVQEATEAACLALKVRSLALRAAPLSPWLWLQDAGDCARVQ